MAKITKTFQYGKHTVTLETGEIARQASGAVIVNMDDTVLLVTAVAAKSAREGQDFFPLTVDYVEKFYAGGRIPGGFFKREGRPTEKETLVSRLIDRPIRPLFPEDYKNEVQIIAQVLSLNPEVDGDIPAMIGASAALSLAGTPFKGPIGAAKVGYKDGQYILNPTASELAESQLELVVAGTANAVLMVESEARLLSEEVMLGAVTYGHREMQKVIQAINELVATMSLPRRAAPTQAVWTTLFPAWTMPLATRTKQPNTARNTRLPARSRPASGRPRKGQRSPASTFGWPTRTQSGVRSTTTSEGPASETMLKKWSTVSSCRSSSRSRVAAGWPPTTCRTRTRRSTISPPWRGAGTRYPRRTSSTSMRFQPSA